MPPSIESAQYETVDNLVSSLGVVGTAYEVLKFIYEFGKTSPIENAIEDIRREISRILVELDHIEDRLEIVTQRLVEAENRERIRVLREQTVEISSLAFQIHNNPGNRVRAAEIAFEAGSRADTFMIDSDLWLWSDVRIVTPRDELGQPVGERRIEPVEPDFKTLPALPVYSMALLTWITAMLIETGSDRAAVQSRYGEQLEKHLAFVSVTFGWQDIGSGAISLPEKIRSRITCQPIAVTKFAENSRCDFTVQCSNTITRTRRIVREFSVPVLDPGPIVLCTINPEVVILDERQLEEEDSAIAMLALWEEMLRSVASTGHLPAEPFIGEFPDWTAAFVGLYGVDRDLNLDYFTQILPTTDGSWTGPLRVGTGWAFEAITHGGSSAVLAKQPTGNWLWYWHQGSEQNPPTDSWRGPNSVGPWIDSDPALIEWLHFGSGFGVVYGIVVSDEIFIGEALPQTGSTTQPPTVTETLLALRSAGIDFSVSEADLRQWLNNPSFTPYPAIAGALLKMLEGKRLRKPVFLDVIVFNYEHAPGASSPRSVEQVDFDLLRKAVVEGYNTRYGETVGKPGSFTVGDLYWNRLNGYQSGQGPFSTATQIGNGWDSLSRVFSGGEGVIYGVRSNGILRWYHHTGWESGANTWADPRDLNTNVDWRQFERIVPGGEGIIYGVLPNGTMRCYRHLDWRSGGDRLEGPLLVGNNWQSYRPLFASLPGAAVGPIVK